MSIIAARVGGSKGTLYNYFPSKDELLLATMLAGAEEFQNTLAKSIDQSLPLEQILVGFIERLLQMLYQDSDTEKLLRVVISVGGTSDVGKRFFEYIGDGVWAQIAQILEQHIQLGNLQEKDPLFMVTHLRGLCDADLLRMLMGAMPSMTDEEIKQRSLQILSTFMDAYRNSQE